MEIVAGAQGVSVKPTTSTRIRSFRGWLVAVAMIQASLVLAGTPSSKPASGSSDIAREWGIEVVALRPTAAGRLIDFRYRIIDPDKAVIFLDRTQKAHLIDQDSGFSAEVPEGKLGPMRQTNRAGKPKAGRIYYMLFTNPGGILTSGSKVTVVVGDFRAEDLTVE
jgi:hypothetical protein